MFKKVVAMLTAFALVIVGMNFAPGTVDAAVTSANGSSSWKLVWNDEFNQTIGGAPDTSVWSYDIGHGDSGWGNNEIQNYTNSTKNVYIADMSSDIGSSDGKALAIKAVREGSEITSGRIKTIGKQYLKYGKVEAKIKVANSMQSGVWPAFWMMGNSMNSGTPWPYCGEIDIMEHRNAEQQIIGTLHWNTGTGTSAGYQHIYRGSETTGNFAHIDSMEDWHKYGIEWYENQIKFFLDDVCYQTLDTTSAEMEEFRESYFLLLNLAIGGPNSPFTLGQTVSDSFTDATMFVDYVRVYQGSDSDFYISKPGVSETSPEPTTTGDGLTACSGEKTNLGGWGYYVLGGNAARYAGGSSLSEEFTLKVTANNKATWNIQAFTQNISVISGHTYNVSVDIDSSAASDAILMKDEIGGTEMVNKALTAGKNTFTGTFTANSDTAQLMFNLGGINAGTTLKFSNVVVTDTTGGEVPVETTTESTQTGTQEWIAVANSNDIFFYDKAGMTNIGGVVNVQKPGFAAEEGIYITVPNGITSVSVNGKTENVAANQGAGTVIYLSALTKKINTVTIYQGGVTSTITIKNINGTDSTEPEETTSEETTTSAVSAVAAPTDVAAYNFYAQSKGYMINFTAATDAVSYNVFMDNSGVLANITESGAYVDASVFKAYADGQLHDLYLQSVDAQGGVSAKSTATKVRVMQETDSASDPADINRIYVVTNSGAKGGADIVKATKTSASLTIISGETGIKTVNNSGTIKRRGNSTSLADKPAYNISFDKKAEVMEGRAKGKKWCLLANAYEKSLLRNKLAMDLGLYAGGIAAAAEYYVDLYIDGVYQGNFVISEPAECGRSGCEYDDSETSDELLFEWEDNEKTEDECLYYRGPKTNVRFVTEDTVDTSSTRYQKWVSTLTTFETALVNTSSDDVFHYMDVDSFVSMYVVNELFQTVDFGYSSVKFYITYDATSGAPTIHAGPLWDFDLSSGNSSFAENRTYDTFRGQNVNAWFGYLMKNETFKSKVIEKYKQLQPRIQNIYKDNQLGTNQITKLSTAIEASRIRNYSPKSSGGAGWSESAADGAEYSIYAYSYSTVAPYSTYTYAQHVDYLRTWLQNRNEWICSQWGINPDDYDGEETTTPEVTTPEETTPETTTPSTDAYTQLADGEWTNVGDSGNISIYAGTWGNGKMSYSGTTDSDLKLRIDSSNGVATESWGIQLKNTLDLVEGKEYTVKVSYTASKAGKLYYKIDGPEVAQEFDAVAGENTAELTVNATAANIAVLALSGFEAGTILSNLKFEVVSNEQQEVVVSGDLQLVGYQISTTYEGIRVAAGVEPTINGQAVKNWGFVYGLAGYKNVDTGITDQDMYVGAENPYIKSYQSTSAGTLNVQLGSSSTATYFARTMKFGASTVTAFTANYKVRAYAILADGSYVYSDISTYSIARVADNLYQEKKMNTATAHNYLYEKILSKVYDGYQEVDFDWNNAVVKPEQIED